jgi:small basic protein
MTLEELAYISQIVGVVAVFASLIFFGLQIRQNTRALRAWLELT